LRSSLAQGEMHPADACVATLGWYDELPTVMVMFILGFFTCKLFMLSGKVAPAGPQCASSTDPANKLGAGPDEQVTEVICCQVPAKASTTPCIASVAADWPGRLWSVLGQNDVPCSPSCGQQEPVDLSEDEDGPDFVTETCIAAKMGQLTCTGMSTTCGRMRGHQHSCANARLPARQHTAQQ